MTHGRQGKGGKNRGRERRNERIIKGKKKRIYRFWGKERNIEIVCLLALKGKGIQLVCKIVTPDKRSAPTW